MNARNITKLSVPLLAAALSLGAAACGSSDSATDSASTDPAAASEDAASGEITISDPWVREPAEGQTLAAGYGTITNGTDEAITLIGASAPITASFEIHETSMSDDGVMSMAEKEDGFEIAPGDSFTLEPGGPHVMMLNIDPAEFTDSLELTYVFDTTEVTVDAEIRPIGDDMGDMDMGDMDMEEMDDDSMGDMEMPTTEG